jgi:hypothetical protein
MAFIARVRTVLNGWAGAPGLSTTYYTDETGGIPGTAAAQNMVDHVRAAFLAAAPLFPTIWNAQVSPTVDVLETTTGILATQVSVTPVALVVGTGGGLFGPAASGLSLNFSTSTVAAGRVVRGRMFLSPMSQAADANGTPTAAGIASANALGAALVGSGTPVIVQIVWHRPKLGVGGVAAPVVGHSVSDRFSVLRSRRG